MGIATKVKVEVAIEMTLTGLQATQLLFFLKTAVTAPRPSYGDEPQSNIVADLANSIESAMIKQGLLK